MSTGRALLRGAGVRVLANFAQMGVALCLTPYIFRYLGDDHYGLWVLVASLLGFYGLLDLGISSGVARFTSRAMGAGDEAEFRRYFATSFWLLCGLGAAVFLLTFGIAWIAAAQASPPDRRAVFGIVTILGATLATLFPARAFTGLLAAHLRFDLASGMTMAAVLIRLPLVLFIFNLGYGLLGLAACFALLQLFEGAGVAFFGFRVHPGLTLSMRHCSRPHARELVGYGFHTLVAQLADIMRFKASPAIITGFASRAAAGWFDFVDKLNRMVGELCKALISILSPVFSRQEGRGDEAGMRRSYLFTCRIATYMAVLLGGMLAMFGGFFLERWVGAQFRYLEPTLQILLIGTVCAGAQQPTVQFLFGTSRHRYYAKTNLIHGILVLGLMAALIRPLGLMGVAIGSSVPTVLVKFFVQPAYACRAMGIPLRRFYVRHALRNLAVPLPFLLAVWFGLRPFAKPEYFNVLFLAGAACTLFVPYVLWVGFSKEERAAILGALLPRTGKPAAEPSPAPPVAEPKRPAPEKVHESVR